jgi:hypothetical protein
MVNSTYSGGAPYTLILQLLHNNPNIPILSIFFKFHITHITKRNTKIIK